MKRSEPFQLLSLEIWKAALILFLKKSSTVPRSNTLPNQLTWEKRFTTRHKELALLPATFGLFSMARELQHCKVLHRLLAGPGA